MSQLEVGARLARRTGAALLLLSAAATAAGAQQGAGATSTAPWRAWLGCWTAGDAGTQPLDRSLPLVCVTPTESPDAVQVATVIDGEVTSMQVVDASGREAPLQAKGCSGSQSGRWSADGRRVYLRATATCDGVLRTTSGILAITQQGEWLEVQGVKVGEEERVRVARYRDAGARASVPAAIAEALGGTEMSVHGARVATGADIGTAAIREAVAQAGVGVVEAFILERQQRFALDARTLVALADAGMPSRITDAMIAASNPRQFAVRAPEPVRGDTLVDEVTGRRVYVMMDRWNSPWGWGYSPYGGPRYGYGYGYSAYGYGYNDYFGGGGYYGYPGYGYGGPVVIVRGNTPPTPHGRMVRGRGYQRPEGSSASDTPTARERTRSARSESSPSRSGESAKTSSGTSGSSGSSDTNGSGGGGRTAKPRP